MQNRHPYRRRLLRACAGLAGLAAALVVAPAASGHAILLETSPSNDSVQDASPSRVSLRFNEPVETAFGSIRVYDGEASRVDRGSVSRPDEHTVALGIGRKLDDGTYTVTWHVVSADAHPVSGAFVFHVGAPGAHAGGVAEQVLGAGTPDSVRALFAIDRFARFALILLVAGGLAMLLTALASAGDPVKRKLAWGVAGCAGALIVVSLLGIVFQGAYAGGFGLVDALDDDVVSSVLDTRFGKVWLVQALIAAAVVVLAILIARRVDMLRSKAVAAVALLLAFGLVLMPALSGHASVTSRLSQAADVVHVGAAAAWAGGLAFVLAGLLLARGERWSLASKAVPRFSSIALVSVGALLLAGALNGYLQVKEVRGLWDTSYGQLLLLKVALVFPVLALGAYNNKFAVPRLRAGDTTPVERTRFLRAVGFELTIVAVVLAVTAVLVQQPPARATVAPSGPYATNTGLGTLDLNLVVDPSEAGANEVHLYLLEKNGQPAEVEDARLNATLPSHGIGPLRLDATRAGPGHYVVPRAVFPIAGDWQLRIEARRGEFESLTQTLSIPIRKD